MLSCSLSTHPGISIAIPRLQVIFQTALLMLALSISAFDGKGICKMIPPTLPEIKELWMGPGRRGACMHTNKSTPAQPQMLMISHTHTDTHIQDLHIKQHVQHKLQMIQVIPWHLYSTRYKTESSLHTHTHISDMENNVCGYRL